MGVGCPGLQLGAPGAMVPQTQSLAFNKACKIPGNQESLLLCSHHTKDKGEYFKFMTTQAAQKIMLRQPH